jgi:hypothetical protein
MQSNDDKFSQYVRSKMKDVAGWFDRIDAEIYGALLSFQSASGLGGAGAEIGVHHGKSLTAIGLRLMPGEKAYCVDVFENQELNLDGSGKGDRTRLEENLLKFGVDLQSVKIQQKSSMDVKPQDILELVGEVRFFNVDGGHWAEIVQSDLALAEGSLAPHGIIAVDDFHSLEWPDVSAGYFAWYASRRKPLVPFAIGFNKLYLCEEDYAKRYQDAVVTHRFLAQCYPRWAVFQGMKLPVFSSRVLPEFSVKRVVFGTMKTLAPDLYERLRHLKSKVIQ